MSEEVKRGTVRAEIERQCSIGAGTATYDAETGLLEVSADLDIGTLERIFATAQPAEARGIVEALSDHIRSASEPSEAMADAMVKAIDAWKLNDAEAMDAAIKDGLDRIANSVMEKAIGDALALAAMGRLSALSATLSPQAGGGDCADEPALCPRCHGGPCDTAPPAPADAGLVEDVSRMARMFQGWIDKGPESQPRHKNGLRPFSTGDLRYIVETMTKAADALRANGAGRGWQDIADCPVNEYVLFLFEGPFHDSEAPGMSVGKLYSDGTIWLTATWAASSAHDDPVKWMPLPTPPNGAGQ